MRRACFGASRLPLSLVKSPHHLRTSQYSNHLLAFKSPFQRQLQNYNHRSFPSTEEQQQQQAYEKEGNQVEAKIRRREKAKSGVLWAIVAANTAVFAAWQYDKFPFTAYHNPTTREVHRWMSFMADNFILSVDNFKKSY